MDFDKIAPDLQTGDVFLFHGTSLIGRIIELITGSPYAHIGMVFRQPGAIGGDGLYLWQSFAPEKGVVLDPLRAFLAGYVPSEPGLTMVARQLAVDRTPAMIAAVVEFMGQVKGRPFPTFQQWITNWIAGNLGIPTPENCFFCSQLVAQTYMQVGLLPPRPLATAYSPARFSAAYAKLGLQLGATFGPEIPITVGPPKVG